MFKVIPYGCNNSEWVTNYSIFNGIPNSEVILYFYDSLGYKKKEIKKTIPHMGQTIINANDVINYVGLADEGRHSLIIQCPESVEVTQIMYNILSKSFVAQQAKEFKGQLKN